MFVREAAVSSTKRSDNALLITFSLQSKQLQADYVSPPFYPRKRNASITKTASTADKHLQLDEQDLVKYRKHCYTDKGLCARCGSAEDRFGTHSIQHATALFSMKEDPAHSTAACGDQEE
jgi:hypothetical protein